MHADEYSTNANHEALGGVEIAMGAALTEEDDFKWKITEALAQSEK